MAEFDCRICGSKDEHRIVRAREMMFGTREEFDYFECRRCGTVQIAAVPDLARHYPPEYLSFDEQRPLVLDETFAKRLAARWAGPRLATGRGIPGDLILWLKPWVADHFPPSLRHPYLALKPSTRILDIGCGRGHLLRTLRCFGFRELQGADAFIDDDLELPGSIRVYRRQISEIEGEYDLVMMHHSFEHMTDPNAALLEVKRLLAPDGICLIRVPLANAAWERYGTDWVQMDPPRHLFLFTERALLSMAEKAGFDIDDVVYDSTSFQFWGSEQYRRDIPLRDERSHDIPLNPKSIFTREQVKEWEDEAAELNRERRGDQACFYLKPRA